MVLAEGVEGAHAALKAKVLSLVSGILQFAMSCVGKKYCASSILLA